VDSTATPMVRVMGAFLAALGMAHAHEYMHVPPGRTGTCLLNGVIMGSQICQTIKPGDDQQCLADPLMYSHLFHMHPAYDNNACGGSTQVVGLRGGSQGILQECGDIKTDPGHFNMSLPGPTPQFAAGEEAELAVKGFFHQGVMRMSLCYTDSSDCSSPEDFNTFVLGYHFTEGTATNASSPDGIYGVVLHCRDCSCGRWCAGAVRSDGRSMDLQWAPSVQLHHACCANLWQRRAGVDLSTGHRRVRREWQRIRHRHCQAVQRAGWCSGFL
jgi:hypothetical protein